MFAAYADAGTSAISTIYFEKDGKPYEKPVEFTIRCYGYRYPPGDTPWWESPRGVISELEDLPGFFPELEDPPSLTTRLRYGAYKPEEVFSHSGFCPQYGCVHYQGESLEDISVDYCDLEGETEGRKFVIEDYLSSSALFVSRCSFSTTLFKKRESGFDSQTACEVRFTLRDEHFIGPESETVSISETEPESESGLPLPQPKPQKRNFFGKIWCFLKGIFGRTCD